MADLKIGVFEAKNRLSELIEKAQRGQRIYITKRGKKVALLTTPEDATPNEFPKGSSLFKEIRAFRRTAKKGSERLKELIEEGRS